MSRSSILIEERFKDFLRGASHVHIARPCPAVVTHATVGFFQQQF
jgi:hypothetical protein